LNCPDYNSPAELKTILDANGFSMQKKFGQNFLINQKAREKLIESLEVQPDTTVWEIGPGLGAMTSGLLEKGADVTVFEIDRGFVNLISQFFEPYTKQNKFRIVEGDVLKTWYNQTQKGTVLPMRFFGNLPYNIAATLVADTIEKGIRF
jgi:16S rRNA (adenine1518-N6/adenine1519-N6)-dimethyltransferase